MSENHTTIAVSRKTHNELNRRKKYDREPLEKVLKRLLKDEHKEEDER